MFASITFYYPYNRLFPFQNLKVLTRKKVENKIKGKSHCLKKFKPASVQTERIQTEYEQIERIQTEYEQIERIYRLNVYGLNMTD